MKEISKYYCAINLNNQERNNSTSGAIFPLLAKEILKEGGIICGVAYDKDMTVRHMFAFTEKEIEKFKGSKYVYSNFSGVFAKIKQFLAEGKKVLFTGTPCQVIALKRYIGEKDSKNLFLMDIICHSTSNPKIFKLYIEYLEKKYNNKVININFRDKTNGWHNSHPTIMFEDGTCVTDTLFYYAFSSNAISMPACFKCNYYGIDRVSDITIGDFWGVDKIMPEMDDNKGTSLIIISTLKGKYLFDKIKDKVKFMEIEKQNVLKYNHHEPAKKHKNYDKIQSMINNKNFMNYLEKSIKKSFFEKVKRKITKFFKK